MKRSRKELRKEKKQEKKLKNLYFHSKNK